MKKTILILMVLVAFSPTVSSQGHFSGRIKLGYSGGSPYFSANEPLFGSLLYAGAYVGEVLALRAIAQEKDVYSAYGRAMTLVDWFFPSMSFSLNAPTGFLGSSPWLIALWNSTPSSQRMTYNGEEVELNYKKPWNLFNFMDQGWKSPTSRSVGYELSWSGRRIPVGLFVGVDYEYRQVNIADFDLPLCGRHVISSVIPSAGLRYRILGTQFESEHNWDIYLEGTVANVRNIKYKNALNIYSVDATESGMRYAVGFGAVAFNGVFPPVCFFIRYSWDDFNFFNAEYVAPDGSKPFDGFDSRRRILSLGFQFGI